MRLNIRRVVVSDDVVGRRRWTAVMASLGNEMRVLASNGSRWGDSRCTASARDGRRVDARGRLRVARGLGGPLQRDRRRRGRALERT